MLSLIQAVRRSTTFVKRLSHGATIVNAPVFMLLFIIYLLIRVGALRLGVPND